MNSLREREKPVTWKERWQLLSHPMTLHCKTMNIPVGNGYSATLGSYVSRVFDSGGKLPRFLVYTLNEKISPREKQIAVPKLSGTGRWAGKCQAKPPSLNLWLWPLRAQITELAATLWAEVRSPIQTSPYQTHIVFWLIPHTLRTEQYVLRSWDSFCSLEPDQHIIRADRHPRAVVWWVRGSLLSSFHPSGPGLSYLSAFRVVISNFHIQKTSQKNDLLYPHEIHHIFNSCTLKRRDTHSFGILGTIFTGT